MSLTKGKKIKTEKVFSKNVLEFFSKKLQSSAWKDIKVAEKVNILDNFTMGKMTEKRWQLFMSGQEQDIVFFKDVLSETDFSAPAIKIPARGPQFGRRQPQGIVMPLVILELKVPQSLDTHQLITYSHIATRIRNLFPHCVYYFILSTNKIRHIEPETILRQAKGFDRTFLEWEGDKEVIWDDIQNHFVYLKRLGIIS